MQTMNTEICRSSSFLTLNIFNTAKYQLIIFIAAMFNKKVEAYICSDLIIMHVCSKKDALVLFPKYPKTNPVYIIQNKIT